MESNRLDTIDKIYCILDIIETNIFKGQPVVEGDVGFAPLLDEEEIQDMKKKLLNLVENMIEEK